MIDMLNKQSAISIFVFLAFITNLSSHLLLADEKDNLLATFSQVDEKSGNESEYYPEVAVEVFFAGANAEMAQNQPSSSFENPYIPVGYRQSLPQRNPNIQKKPSDASHAVPQSQRKEQADALEKANRSLVQSKAQSGPCSKDPLQEGYIINFNDVSVIEYIRFLSKVTNANFVFEEADLNFNVTIVAEEPTSIDDIRSALLQVLRVNGLALAEEGNNVIIHRNPEVATVAKVISDELDNICDGTEALITRVFRLKNINPMRLATIISPMVSKGAIVEVSPETHHLVVTDVTSNVERIGELLKSLDNPNAAFEVGTFQPKHTFINTLVPLAEKILSPMLEGQPMIMVPQEASDTIYIVSSPSLVERAIDLLKMLDIGSHSPFELPDGHIEKTHFYVYKLQFHKGDTIKTALEDIGADLAKTGAMNMNLMYTINSAQWIEATNSLLFIGDKESLEKVKELLAALDAPLKQVFIEALIIKTTINNSINFGVQYGARGRRFDDVSGTGSLITTSDPNSGNAQIPNILHALATTTGGSVPVAAFENTLGLNTGVIGNAISAGGNLFFDIAALVSALQTDTDTDILMNPKIVTQDTIPATLFVGSTRPYQTNSILQAGGSGSSNNFVTASIEYRELGMTLNVTPYLGDSDMITMEIVQELSSFDSNATASSGGGSAGSSNFTLVPITSNSKTATRVHVPNEHFLILSGMVEEDASRSKSAIPCLGGIPILGNFLGSKTNSMNRDNLIIFLRPHIINTSEQIKKVTDREEKFFSEKSKTDSFLENSVKLWNMKK